MGSNLKLALAGVALLVALVMCVAEFKIEPGTGVATATILGGAGWLIRELERESSERKSVFQAYAAVITTQYGFIWETLNDAELQRWLTVSPRIKSGEEAETVGRRPVDPYPVLPDIKKFLHLFSPQSIDWLCQWHYRDVDMVDTWQELGTKALADVGPARLDQYFQRVSDNRRNYRDVCYTALICLKAEFPGLQLDLRGFRRDGDVAHDLRQSDNSLKASV